MKGDHAKKSCPEALVNKQKHRNCGLLEGIGYVCVSISEQEEHQQIKWG